MDAKKIHAKRSFGIIGIPPFNTVNFQVSLAPFCVYFLFPARAGFKKSNKIKEIETVMISLT
jgi:hypothetical protein